MNAFRLASTPIKPFGIAKDIKEFSRHSRHNHFAMEIVEHDVLDATNGQDTPAKRLARLPQLLEAINTATTEGELKLFYAQAYRAAKDVEDTDAMQTIVAAKNARKLAMEAA